MKAFVDESHDPLAVFLLPSQLPTIEMLRRPIEFTQYTSIRYSDRLHAAGIAASIGSIGDSFDNAMAESLNGTYKAELVKLHGPWRTKQQLEIATIEWINWYNASRWGRSSMVRSATSHQSSVKRCGTVNKN